MKKIQTKIKLSHKSHDKVNQAIKILVDFFLEMCLFSNDFDMFMGFMNTFVAFSLFYS
jgi:hypothetical protein